ncbi:MAG TPA: DNA-processing protein DprA [Gemmatimonadaceae bacterium]|nr:DNA-processing protein DprA [Gemmatimonadaceae bacterium]
MKLRAIDGIGDSLTLALVREWGTPDAVLRAAEGDLADRGCSPKLTEAIVRGPDSDACRRIARELEVIDRKHIHVLTVLDPHYPRRLLMIPDPPPLLYVSGTLRDADELAVAVVGARRATAAGRLVTERLAGELAEAGFTIISGLARGADAAAHRGALAAGGRTVAVLGCGLGRTYPAEHERLRREIEEEGAVLSEVSLDAPPHSAHFPRRNRIISGLSFGVVVTEAAIDSGSLITAQLAADQGREVFAVPGCVSVETSRGTHALIKEGAVLVEQAQDVIDVLLPQLESAMKSRVRKVVSSSKALAGHLGNHERLVYDALSHEPLTVDHLLERTQLPVSSVMASLLSLELGQRVRQLAGQRYVRL